MGRRRSAALRDAAGVYHVASRLASEGFHATVARGSNARADVLVGLPGSSVIAALTVRTAACPLGFAEGTEGRTDVCEWRMGEGVAPAEDLGPFVALVDLKRARELPRVWVLPSAEVRGHVASLGQSGSWRYGPSAAERQRSAREETGG